MRVTINFHNNIHIARRREFRARLFQEANSAGGEPTLVGASGLSVRNLSWDEAFGFASKLMVIVRRMGGEHVDSLRMDVQEDPEETDMTIWVDKFKIRRAAEEKTLPPD